MLSSYSHGYGQSSYHIILVPKYRHRAFAREEGMRVHALEVMPDHIHLFLEIPPSKLMARVMHLLKGKTAYHLFRVFPELRGMFKRGHLWSRGKFFCSMGEVTADAIEHYILESQSSGRRTRPSIQQASPPGTRRGMYSPL